MTPPEQELEFFNGNNTLKYNGKTYIAIDSDDNCNGCAFEDSTMCLDVNEMRCVHTDHNGGGGFIIWKEREITDIWDGKWCAEEITNKEIDELHSDIPSQVEHPEHYTTHPSGIECITITKHMNFCLGNAIKYIWRAGLKGNAIEDLQKAIQYLEFEINRIGAKK